MKIPSLVLLFVVVGARCWAYPLGDAADIAVPSGWLQGDPTEPGAPPIPFPTLEFHPKDGRNEKVLLTLLPAATLHVSDRASLKGFLLRASAPMLPSPDFVPEMKDMEIAGAIGSYATFVDPSLVGRPPEKGNYKVATPAIVLLPGGYVVQATVFTDTISGADFDEALGLVKNLTPLEPKAHGEAPGEVSFSGLDAKLQIPSARFTRKMEGLNTNPNYFSFMDGQGVMLSGWLDHASAFPGMAPFWAKEKDALLKGGFEVKSEMAVKVGSWDAILYVVPIGGGIEQKNIRACRVLGGTWADIHLSRTAEGSTFGELEDVVRSLDLVAAGASEHAQ
jgi:hypothetical protein